MIDKCAGVYGDVLGYESPPRGLQITAYKLYALQMHDTVKMCFTDIIF